MGAVSTRKGYPLMVPLLHKDWKSSSTQGTGESVLGRTAVWQQPLARKECRMYASLSSTFSHQSQSPDYDITVSECRFVQIHWQLLPSINDSNIQTTAMVSNLKQKSNYTYLVIAGVVTPLVRKVDFPRTTGTSVFSEPPFKYVNSWSCACLISSL